MRTTIWISLAALIACAGPTHAQTLYALEFDTGLAFAEVNRTTGADVMTIGMPAAFNKSKGMAMDPTTGTMFVIQDNGMGPFGLYTIDVVTAATNLIGAINDGMAGNPLVRDITFDNTGQLWGVTGNSGPQLNAVLPIDKATAVTGATLAGTLGSVQQTIAYRPANGQLYVYSANGPTKAFQRIDPMSGMSTTITLSGTAPTVRNKGMVFDPIDNLFRMFDDNGNYFTISPGGVQTDTGNNNTTIYMGLAFDQTTTVPVELSSFDIE